MADGHYKSGMAELGQVEGKRRCRNAETLGDVARRETGRARLNQQAEERQARILGERPEGTDDRIRFHASKIIKLKTNVKPSPLTDERRTPG